MSTAPPPPAFPEPGHDHRACRDATMARAERIFAERGLRLTGLRANVLGEIAASHHAIGAYDIIDRLARAGIKVAPISVYRAIEALMAAGVVHRLESRNAYFACHTTHAGIGHQHVVLACARCGTVAEVAATDVFTALDAAVGRAGFVARARLIEVDGSCAACTQGEADAP